MAVAATVRGVRTLKDAALAAGPARRLLAIEALLILAALATSGLLRQLLAAAVAATAVGAMALGIRRHRPTPAYGWWALLGSTVTIVLAAAAGDLLPAGAMASHGLFTLTHVLVIVGLAVVGSPDSRRRGCADLLDAAVVAAALFPLLWLMVIAPALSAENIPVTVALAYPFANLLTLILAVRLVLAGGLRHRSAVLLLAGAAALLAINVRMLASPTLVTPGHSGSLSLLWTAHPVAFGLAALRLGGKAPARAAQSPTRQPPRPRIYSSAAHAETVVSLPRIVLLAVLATAVPLICMVAYYRNPRAGLTWADYNALAFLGPLVLVAFLLLGRLIVIARVAQQRAAELSRQARELAEAVGAQEELRRQLTYRALHDPLTGLANRVMLAERLDWALSRRTGTQRHALLVLDLDSFKDVNDDLGHPVGDEVLLATTHRLLSAAPQGATVARIGGDEFAVLLEDVDAEQATATADHLLAAVRRPFDVSAGQLYLTASVGMLLVDTVAEQTTAAAALRDADLALNAAKRGGKDRVLVFDPAMRQARLGHSRVAAGLRRALVNNELTVHYQPVVDLATGRIRAVEALVRWTPPNAPPMPAGEFVLVAEETGLIRDIGAWVLRRACQEARAWHARAGVAVSVNVSGRQLVEPGFAEQVLDAIARAGLPGTALILEVTETSLIATATVATAAAQLNEVRRRGVRVAIDDFGTGYSSLSYLAQLPVDILKIDSSFTRHGGRLDFGPDDWPFARAIVALGHGLNLATVAEGIETVEQAEALRGLGCQLAQGYLFSRPLPAAGIDELVAAGASLPYDARPAEAPVRDWSATLEMNDFPEIGDSVLRRA